MERQLRKKQAAQKRSATPGLGGSTLEPLPPAKQGHVRRDKRRFREECGAQGIEVPGWAQMAAPKPTVPKAGQSTMGTKGKWGGVPGQLLLAAPSKARPSTSSSAEAWAARR